MNLSKKNKWEPRVKVVEYSEGELAAEMVLRPSPVVWHLLLYKYQIIWILSLLTLVWVVLVPISSQEFGVDVASLITYLAFFSYPLALAIWSVGVYLYTRREQVLVVSVYRDGAVYLDRNRKSQMRVYNLPGSEDVDMRATVNKDLTVNLTLSYHYVTDYYKTFYHIQKSDLDNLVAFMREHEIGRGYSIVNETMAREFERL